MKTDGIFACLSSCRRRPLLILLAAVGVLCLLLGGLRLGSSSEGSEGLTGSDESYRLALEARLCELISSVKGVGAPEVFVTLECGEEHHYSGGKLLSSEPPRVLGVAVVCYGGGNDALRAELTSLLSSLLGIGTHRIHIAEKSS